MNAYIESYINKLVRGVNTKYNEDLDNSNIETLKKESKELLDKFLLNIYNVVETSLIPYNNFPKEMNDILELVKDNNNTYKKILENHIDKIGEIDKEDKMRVLDIKIFLDYINNINIYEEFKSAVTNFHTFKGKEQQKLIKIKEHLDYFYKKISESIEENKEVLELILRFQQYIKEGMNYIKINLSNISIGKNIAIELQYRDYLKLLYKEYRLEDFLGSMMRPTKSEPDSKLNNTIVLEEELKLIPTNNINLTQEQLTIIFKTYSDTKTWELNGETYQQSFDDYLKGLVLGFSDPEDDSDSNINYFIIEEKGGEQKILGTLNLYSLGIKKEKHIGITIFSEYRNQKIGKKCIEYLTKYFIKNQKDFYFDLVALINPYNVPSKKIFEQRFKYIGVIPYYNSIQNKYLLNLTGEKNVQ